MSLHIRNVAKNYMYVYLYENIIFWGINGQFNHYIKYIGQNIKLGLFSITMKLSI